MAFEVIGRDDLDLVAPFTPVQQYSVLDLSLIFYLLEVIYLSGWVHRRHSRSAQPFEAPLI